MVISRVHFAAMIACVLGALLSCGRAMAGEAAERGPFDGYAFIAAYADNNVFLYSDVDRQRFESGVPAGGKYPIQDLADIVTTLAARGDLRWDVQPYSLWRVRLMYDANVYARNTDRTNQRLGVSLQRQLRHAHASVTANYVPDFYLRHLYWRPMPGRPPGIRYAAARYDKMEITAEGSLRLSRIVDGLLGLGFARRDYDFPFDERDNNTYSIDAGAEVRVRPRLSLSFMFNVDLLHASGADSTSLAAEDISNNQFGFELGGSWRMNEWLRFVQTFDYSHQVYTTGNVADLPHHDRKDDEFGTRSEFRMGPFSGWQPDVFIEYHTSKSSVPPGIAEFGQYTAFRVGIQVTYYF